MALSSRPRPIANLERVCPVTIRFASSAGSTPNEPLDSFDDWVRIHIEMLNACESRHLEAH